MGLQKIVLIFCLCSFMLGCEIQKEPTQVQHPQALPQTSSIPTLPPSQQSYSDEPNEKATNEPSVAVSPSSNPKPSSEAIDELPEELQNLEQLETFVYCESEDEFEKRPPRLFFPVDLTVSPDGQEFHIMNYRCQNQEYTQFLSIGECVLPDDEWYLPRNNITNRQAILHLNAGKLSYLKINQKFPESCHMGDEIERDEEGNLYFNDPYRRRIYKIDSFGLGYNLLYEDFEYTGDCQDSCRLNQAVLTSNMCC